MNVPTLGDAVPHRGNRTSKAVIRAILVVLGWQIIGRIPDLPKFVIIAAPHTSNWDFLLAMGFIFTVGIRVSWMGKHTFVNGPLGPLLRWIGGVAIDRRSPKGVVAQMVAEYERRDKFILGLTPEGTRQKAPQWKTGFYHIAYAANVPILPISFDYERKVIGIGTQLMPTGEIETELEQIKSLFANIEGKNPHQF